MDPLSSVATYVRRAFDVDTDDVDDDGKIRKPPGAKGALKQCLNDVCRAVVTSGWHIPFVQASASQVRDYWQSRTEGEPNAPSSYATKDVRIVDYLDSFWKPEVSPKMSVLEIGTNAGANLARLREL